MVRLIQDSVLVLSVWFNLLQGWEIYVMSFPSQEHRVTLNFKDKKKRLSEKIASSLCAVHGNQLGGASPLWGYVIANH